MYEQYVDESVSREKTKNRRKILVVGNGTFSTGIVDYSIHLADRLNCDLLALNVGMTGEELSELYKNNGQELFKQRAYEATQGLRQKADKFGIHCSHVVKFGDVGIKVHEVCHEVKRIEFVVTESEAGKEEISGEVTIPVFSVISDNFIKKGEKIMKEQGGKKGVIGKMIGYGAITAALYAVLFSNADSVMKLFTKGGLYAALPIVTVFAFSFAHAAFASNLWSALGIEAMKKDTQRMPVQKVVYDKKRARKRPRVYARVNPFHRL